MGESLYAILGVDRDADQETITDAYRDRAKNQHPDVSDAPDATGQFKRLTIARDTLLDAGERARYDDIGHESYVRQHARSDLFDVSASVSEGVTTGETAESDSISVETVTDGYGGDDWWRERAGPDPKPAGAGRSATTQSRNGAAASWAQSRPTQSTDTTRSDRSVAGFVQTVGVWIVLHVLLFCSAVATAIFLYTSVGPPFSAPAMVFGLVLLVVTVGVSTFHLVSIIYT
jgi:curved DNA-binding protein CbpA